MGTMAKKAKKVRAEVIVTPEQASAVELPESEEEVKPKKKSKKKNKEVVESSEAVETAAGLNSPDTEVIKSKKKNKKKNKDTTDSSETAKPESSGSDVATEKITARPATEGNPGPKSSKERMKADYSYITSFLGSIHIPQHKRVEDGLLENTVEDGETLEEKQKRVKPGATSRAANTEELRDRLKAKLEELRGNINVNDKKKEKKLKKKLARIEKNKKESNELKQKLMTLGKNAGNKGNLLKASETVGALPKNKGVKTEKGVVFSKFDFKDDLSKPEAKKSMDPQAALNKLKKEKEKIKMWEEKGRTEKASKIENNIAWDKALNKAQGEKVKDDVTLLKKSIKKQKQIKTSSKKKWEKRADEVKNKESAFVEKREGNMAKRKKDKHDKKMKKLVAKGRHVPGF